MEDEYKERFFMLHFKSVDDFSIRECFYELSSYQMEKDFFKGIIGWRCPVKINKKYESESVEKNLVLLLIEILSEDMEILKKEYLEDEKELLETKSKLT